MKTKIQLILFLVGSFVFHFLFWKETSGLNVLLFSAFNVSTLLYLNPNSLYKTSVKTAISLLIVASFSIVFHPSTFNIIMYWLALFVFAGLVWNSAYTSNLLAVRSSLANLFVFIRGLKENIHSSFPNKNNHPNKIIKLLKISVIPIIIVCAFLFIYRGANEEFSNLLDRLITSISFDFEKITLSSVLFYLFGLWIVGSLIFNGINRKKIVVGEPDENMNRQRKKFHNNSLSRALENEYLTALITLILVNLLTGLVNVIDLKWVWLDYTNKTASQLSQFVHQGTYLLVFSILLASSIVLFFFRHNLNFYSKSNIIRTLAYVWLIQNFFMMLSVGVRNYHYIHEYGFAYKRLGVIFFLTIVGVGLMSLLYKLYAKKTFWFLLKFNSWSAFIILLVVSCINWDIIIARYNIHNTQNEIVDAHFLLQLSPSTYSYLHENRYLVQSKGASYFHDNFTKILRERQEYFAASYKSRTWLSWSYSAHKAYYSIPKYNSLTQNSER